MKPLYLLIYVILASGCASSGSGIILDSETNETISNARVKLQCYRTDGYHSSKHIRDVIETSDNNGQFSFSISDVFGCSTIYTHATKKNYIESGSLHPGYSNTCCESVPEIIFMTKNKDANMVNLRFLCRHVGMRLTRKINYEIGLRDFLRSVKVAKTKKEIDFVKQCYCDVLNDRFNHMTSDDLKWLGERNINRNTHTNKVENYCSTNI